MKSLNFEALKLETLKLETRLIFDHLYLVFSSISVILCQSRTGVFIMVILFLIYFIKNNISYKIILIQISTIILILFIIYLVDFYTFEYVSKFKFNSTTNTSISGRLEVYANHISPENEYIFMQWRFGIFGLLFYLFILIYPLIITNKSIKLRNNFYFYILLIILFTALTNNPLSESRIFVLFVLIVSYSFAIYSKNKLEENV